MVCLVRAVVGDDLTVGPERNLNVALQSLLHPKVEDHFQ
jgi:hypothetical protein